MINIKKVDKLQEEFLNKLTVPELKEYILKLSIEYYTSLASKNNERFNLIVATFEKIIDLNPELNVEDYISYCLIEIFNKSILNSDKVINLKEPKLIAESDVKAFYVASDLEKIVQYYTFKRTEERLKELSNANLSEEAVLELLNFNDYYIGASKND